MKICMNMKTILTVCVALFSSSFTAAQGPGFEVAAVFGDPHFRTWSGDSYDFHGVCDLVLLKNAFFDEGLGMDIHLRSKRMNQKFSYVDSASIRIGEDILEVKGGKQEENRGFWINSVQGTGNEEMMKLSGKYSVRMEELSKKSRQFTINLGGKDKETKIVIKTWNAMVRVSFENATSEHFGASLGMMGAFLTGERVARDGVTSIDDVNSFGREWQVLPSESKLFHGVDDVPQSPTHCEIPSSADMRRRLGEINMPMKEAEVACARVDPSDFDLCVFDVMASNNKDFAGAY